MRCLFKKIQLNLWILGNYAEDIRMMPSGVVGEITIWKGKAQNAYYMLTRAGSSQNKTMKSTQRCRYADSVYRHDVNGHTKENLSRLQTSRKVAQSVSGASCKSINLQEKCFPSFLVKFLNLITAWFDVIISCHVRFPWYIWLTIVNMMSFIMKRRTSTASHKMMYLCLFFPCRSMTLLNVRNYFCSNDT